MTMTSKLTELPPVLQRAVEIMFLRNTDEAVNETSVWFDNLTVEKQGKALERCIEWFKLMDKMEN